MSFSFVDSVLTPAEFTTYVNSYQFGPVPPDFVVLHHTAIPAASWAKAGMPDKFWDAGEFGLTDAQIKDKRHQKLRNLQSFYEHTNNWDAGPHLFIDNKYVYLMSPMNAPGIHAKWGNSFVQNKRLHYSIGIEVIGCYTSVMWPAPVAAVVRSAVQALQTRLKTFSLDYMYSNPATRPGCAIRREGNKSIQYCPHPERLKWGGLSSHRDYNKPVCPGNAVTEARYVAAIRGIAPAPLSDTERVYTVAVIAARVRAKPTLTATVLATLPRGTVLRGTVTTDNTEAVSGSIAWVHAPSVGGYIWAGLLHEEKAS